MKNLRQLTFLLFTFCLSNFALAATSSCYSFNTVVGGLIQPNFVHETSFTWNDDNYFATHLRKYTNQSTPVVAIHDVTVAAVIGTYNNVSSTIPSAGTYTLDGYGQSGKDDPWIPVFTANCLKLISTYTAPSTTTFTITPSTAYVGDSVNFSWSASSQPSPGYCTLLPLITLNASGNENITAAVVDTGTYSINCTNIFGTSSATTRTLTVTHPTCTTASVDSAAISTLNGWATSVPHEQGISLLCTVPNAPTGDHPSTSWSQSWGTSGPTMDPCRVNIGWNSENAKAGLHRHPFFTSVAEYEAGVTCHQDPISRTLSEVLTLNTDNNNFGPGDYTFSNTKGPIYLLTPTGSNIKRLTNGVSSTIQ